MAPDLPTNLREVYIARFEMSSPNQTAERKEIDEMHEEITLEFPKEIRERIAQVRTKYRNLILKECVHFHGLQVVSAETRERVREYVEQADAELRAINEQLHATLVLIPVSLDAEAKGTLYTMVTNAIKGQIYGALLERLRKLAGKEDIPMRSRTALIDLCDRAKAWNVLGDPDLAQSLESYRKLIENGILQPIVQEAEKVAAALDNPAAYAEL